MLRKISLVVVAMFVLVSLLAEHSFAQGGISRGEFRFNQRDPHHGILINDVFVAPVAHDEPAYPCCEDYPCCEKSCGKTTSQCAGCPGGECDRADDCVKCKKLAHKDCQRCKDGSCSWSFERKKSPAAAREPANETARAVLEIMDALGHSVIAGTEFEPHEQSAPEELPAPLGDPADIRAALIKYIHALQAEHAAEKAEDAATVNISDEEFATREMRAEPASSVDDTVETLRESSAALDEAASQLEALELYERADQVRTLAQELRHDARRMKSGGRVVHARRHYAPVVEPTSDEACPLDCPAGVERRLRVLREAMRRAAE